jgi:hypothetical protein
MVVPRTRTLHLSGHRKQQFFGPDLRPELHANRQTRLIGPERQRHRWTSGSVEQRGERDVIGQSTEVSEPALFGGAVVADRRRRMGQGRGEQQIAARKEGRQLRGHLATRHLRVYVIESAEVFRTFDRRLRCWFKILNRRPSRPGDRDSRATSLHSRQPQHSRDAQLRRQSPR